MCVCVCAMHLNRLAVRLTNFTEIMCRRRRWRLRRRDCHLADARQKWICANERFVQPHADLGWLHCSVTSIANRLCHSSALRSISGFVFTVNHYYGHCVHILNMNMFVPFRSFIFTMPQTVDATTFTPNNATIIIFWKIYTHDVALYIYARWRCGVNMRDIHEIATERDAQPLTPVTLTLETFKTHFKMIFCNELWTCRWIDINGSRCLCALSSSCKSIHSTKLATKRNELVYFVC